MVYAHAQTCPRIPPHGPACAPQYQTFRSSSLKYRTGWFYAHAQTCPRRPSTSPSSCTTMPNFSQLLPEIQNRMLYAHAQEQTCPRIQPNGPIRAPQCQTCRSSFLKHGTGWFMRMRRLFLKSNHVSQLVHHNAKLVAVLS